MQTVGVRTMERPKAGGDGAEIVDLLASEERALVGGKAAPLARAAAAGHRVPPGIVVTTRAGGVPEDLAARLAALGPGPFAVRSSAASEDSSARSFAGQLETLLNVPAEEVPRAVERCRASATAMRVLRYAGGAGEVAVIVQAMVPADVAGVAFSADPRTGERGVAIVEAVAGLGDRLVGGEVDAEAWRVEGARPERTRRNGAAVLDEALVTRIASLVRALEDLFGAPQDVEWAVAGGELFLLQSRPITALPAAPIPVEIVPPEGDWERDDHHAVLSPLGWAWFPPYAKAMAADMGKLMPVKDIELTNVGGHLYTRMVMPGGGGAPPPRWVLWLVSRLLPSLRKANRLSAELIDGEAFVADHDAWDREGRAAMAAATDALFDPHPERLSDEALLARIGEALAHTARGLAKHAALGGPSLMGVGKLVLFLEDELGWDANRVFELVRGSSRETTELHRRIEAIVANHEAELDGAFPHTWAELFDRAPAMGAALADWLAANHLRMMHYDPKHSSLGERPDLVLAIAQAVYDGRRHGDAAPPHENGAAALEEARAALSPERFAELERLVALARRGYGLRDENGIETVSRPAGLLRWYVRELGRRLPLEAPEHAVYLTVEEHGPALRGEIADLRARVERRRGEESWAIRNRPPRRFGKAPDAMPPADAFPPGLAKMMRIFGWMMKTEEVPEGEAADGALRGVGIGARVVTAKARVVHRPEELVSLRHGEVLVCRITSPEWSVALGRVGALVTNEGGLLSHPAIIAREYGITGVLGCGAATERIRTGDTVRVDPIEGTVRVL